MKTKTPATKMARPLPPATTALAAPIPPAKTSKLDLLVNQLSAPNGATLEALMVQTGWQAHSVRGAIAGALKKRGHAITSTKADGVRRYAIASTADGQ